MTPSSRRYFEARLGHDFSKVRIHRGEQANRATDTMNARAFSVGNNVVLGKHVQSEQHPRGKATLAHELAHVAQRRAGVASAGPSELRNAEAEAHSVAQLAVSGGAATLRQRVAPHHVLCEPKTGGTDSKPGLGVPSLEMPSLGGSKPLEGVKEKHIRNGLITSHRYELFGFDTGDDTLTGDHRSALIDIAIKWGMSYVKPQVVIVGGADKIGTDKDNLVLGQKRANTVGMALSALLNTKLPPSVFLSMSSAGEPAEGATVADANLRKVTIMFSTYDALPKLPPPPPDAETTPSPDPPKTDATTPTESSKEDSGKFEIGGAVSLGLSLKRQVEKDPDSDEKKIALQLAEEVEGKLKLKYGKEFEVVVSLRYEHADTVGGDSKVKGSDTGAIKTKFDWKIVSVDGHAVNIGVVGSGEISAVRKEDSSGEVKTKTKLKGKTYTEISYSYNVTDWLKLSAALQLGASFTGDGSKFLNNYGIGADFQLYKNKETKRSFGAGVQTMISPTGEVIFGIGAGAKF